MRPNLGTAIKSFGLKDFVIEGNPTSQEEFDEMFKFVVGTDEIGRGILSNDLSSITFTWEELEQRYLDLLNEYPLTLLRKKRNEMLADTDYWELPSQLPMSDERANYRQALRDITNTYTSLDDVVWPEKPE